MVIPFRWGLWYPVCQSYLIPIQLASFTQLSACGYLIMWPGFTNSGHFSQAEKIQIYAQVLFTILTKAKFTLLIWTQWPLTQRINWIWTSKTFYSNDFWPWCFNCAIFISLYIQILHLLPKNSFTPRNTYIIFEISFHLW